MRKVYTYSDVNSLDKLSYFEEIRKYPHIVANYDMLNGLRERYKEQLDYVVDIHAIQDQVCGEWSSTATIFEQYISISALLRRMTNLPNTYRQLGESFSKNRKDIFNSIRALVETGLFPEDLNPENDEERLFKAIWEKAETDNLSYGVFRSKIFRYENDEESFKAVLKDYPKIVTSNTLVLHGFYYITAFQERIFRILESCGKQLIFLGCIDQSQDVVNQIWLENFTETNGFEPTDCWIKGEEECNKRSFECIFKGIEAPEPLKNVTIRKYKNEASFIKDISRIDEEGYKIYSMDLKKSEAILKEVCPEKFKKRHLLSYPAGQYFYTLHSLWDAKKTCLSIDAESIQRCLSSGWVTAGGKNGRDYTHQFEMMAPFFENCHDFNSWRERMADLRQLSATFDELFEKHIKDLPVKNINRHRIMSNPFLNFSFMAVEKKDADAVFDFITSIFKLADDLFGDGSEIDISKHFEKIAQIIKDGVDEASLYKEEIEIIKDIRERVENPHFAVKSCMPEDISEAMMMIIGGGVLNDDNFEALAAGDEDYVQAMYQMDAAPLVSAGKIHLCFADEMHLPGVGKSYTWPLNHDMLTRMVDNISVERRQYLLDYMFVTEQTLLANRYLFNSLLQNQNVELSWIEEENGKKIAESPYIRMLSTVFGCDVKDVFDENNVNVEEVQEQAARTFIVDDSEATLEEKLDLMQCPWKYAYGYIANKFPSYKSSFHYNFVIASIIGAFSISSGFSKEEVSRNVFDCFAYLKNIEKRNIRDFAPSSFDCSEDTLDGVSYTRLRLMPHFANRTMASSTFSTYVQTKEQAADSNDAKVLFFGNNTNADYCKYCQYKDECIHIALEEE